MSLLRDSRLSYVALVEYCDTTFTSGALFIASGCSVEANSAFREPSEQCFAETCPATPLLARFKQQFAKHGATKAVTRILCLLRGCIYIFISRYFGL